MLKLNNVKRIEGKNSYTTDEFSGESSSCVEARIAFHTVHTCAVSVLILKQEQTQNA